MSSEHPEAVRADGVQLTGGPWLAVQRAEGPLRPFLLVPDAARSAESWQPVARRLNAAGHEVAAVDLRGQGGSEPTDGGYDTDTCADDLATLVDLLGFTGPRSPVVAGHGWGADVALSLAARRDGVAAIGCVAGGWTRPAWRYPTFEDCWTALAPDAARLAGAALQRRREIVRSVWLGEPRALYPLVRVPVALCPVVPADGEPDPTGRAAMTRTGVAEACAGLAQAHVSWYYDGPDVLSAASVRLSEDLLALASDAEPAAV